MYYYFSASFDAVIKLNGTYFGKINDTIKFIDLSDFNTFVEVCSLSPTDKSLNFILDENFLNNPPPYCSVTDMKGGYLIKFNRSYSFSEFKVIGQKRFDGLD